MNNTGGELLHGEKKIIYHLLSVTAEMNSESPAWPSLCRTVGTAATCHLLPASLKWHRQMIFLKHVIQHTQKSKKATPWFSGSTTVLPCTGLLCSARDLFCRMHSKTAATTAPCLQRDNNLDSKNMNPAQLFVLIYKQDTALIYAHLHMKIAGVFTVHWGDQNSFGAAVLWPSQQTIKYISLLISGKASTVTRERLKWMTGVLHKRYWFCFSKHSQ